MKIILLKDVAKLGKKYDIKDVSSGHGLNLLIPQGFAVAATPQTIKKMSVEIKQADVERKIREDLLVKNIKDLEDITLTIIEKANDKGHLFAGIHKPEIVDELLKQTQLQIDPSFIQLDQPIKQIGEYSIEVKGGGKTTRLKVIIEAKK